MKKTKYILLIIFMFAFMVNVKADDEEFTKLPNFEYNYFIKQDEDGNLVPNAKFEQRSLNGNVIIELEPYIVDDMPSPSVDPIEPKNIDGVQSTLASPPGRYKYIMAISDNNMVLNLLTSEQKEIMSNIKSYSDYLNYKNILTIDEETMMCGGKANAIELFKKNKGIWSIDSNGLFVDSGKELYNSSETENDHIIAFYNLTSMIIEEVQMPKGLQKSYVVVPMAAIIAYKVNEDGSLTILDEHTYAMQIGKLLKYDKNINYNSISDMISKLDNTYEYETTCTLPYSNRTWFDFTCDNSANNQNQYSNNGIDSVDLPFISGASYETNAKSGTNPACPYGGATIIDKKGAPSLKISTYVDGKQRLNTKKDTTAIISVKLENNGTAGSYNNKIVSRVPKNLVYVDDKEINKYGVYNREDGTVTWNLEYLDSLDAAMFSYKVSIPATADISMLYTSTATVESMDTSTPIVSDAAEIDLADVVNPKTGDTRALYIFTSLIIAVTILLYVVNQKQIKEL